MWLPVEHWLCPYFFLYRQISKFSNVKKLFDANIHSGSGLTSLCIWKVRKLSGSKVWKKPQKSSHCFCCCSQQTNLSHHKPQKNTTQHGLKRIFLNFSHWIHFISLVGLFLLGCNIGWFVTSTGKAQFRLEQTGKNDIPSNVIISSDASQDSWVRDLG